MIYLFILIAVSFESFAYSFQIHTRDQFRCDNIASLPVKEQKMAPSKVLPLGCKKYYDFVAKLSDDQLMKKPLNQITNAVCLKNTVNSMKNTGLSGQISHCLSSQANLNSPTCGSIQKSYRDLAIARLYPQVINLEKLDVTVLLNKLLILILDNNGFKYPKESLDSGLILNNELLKRLPNCYGLYKAKLVNLFHRENDLEENHEEEIQAIYKQTENMNRKDDILDFKLVRMIFRQKDKNKREVELDAFIKENPLNVQALYLKAGNWWKKQNRQMAKHWLEEAFKIDTKPKLDYVQEALKRVNDAPFAAPIFSIKMDIVF